MLYWVTGTSDVSLLRSIDIIPASALKRISISKHGTASDIKIYLSPKVSHTPVTTLPHPPDTPMISCISYVKQLITNCKQAGARSISSSTNLFLGFGKYFWWTQCIVEVSNVRIFLGVRAKRSLVPMQCIVTYELLALTPWI